MKNYYRNIDFEKEPEKYKVGRGEMGVLSASPFKERILEHWAFATPDKAKKSAEKIYSMFLQYRKDENFVGADMAFKFLLMGYTRSKRYSNYPKTNEFRAGQKYIGPVPADKKGVSGSHGRQQREKGFDPIKEESAQIFSDYVKKVKANQSFMEQRKQWREQYG